MRGMSEIHRHQLDNGVQVVAEPIEGMQSLAMTLLVPAGVASEPGQGQGASAMLAEMICRGAGGRSAREHSDALDQLGVQRSTSVQTRHLRLGATMIGSKAGEALGLLFDMIRRPNLAKASLEPSRDLCLQSIDALADEPQQRAMLELRHRHFPEPLGRSPLGQREGIERLTLEQVRRFWESTFVASGSILAFAGKVDWPRLKDQVASLLGDWSGRFDEAAVEAAGARGYEHLKAETSQVHIGIAYDAPAEPANDSIYQRAAAAVLSGGMSGRLFTEVREKRGLCYAVSAGYLGQKDRGAMLGYAGTTPARAQQTLDVFTGELRRLSEGVNESEFGRAIVGMKSRLVMQGESSSARAGSIASDVYLRGEPRTLDDLAGEVDAVTLEKLNAYLAAHEPGAMTIVTIGPTALEVGAGATA